MTDCVRQTTPKYRRRPSPPYPANKCPTGSKRIGNDGLKYVAKADKNGINHWTVIGKKKSAKKKSPENKSLKKKSPENKSLKKKSPKKKSPKKKSPKKKSPKKKSPKKKSPKKKSPKKKSLKKKSLKK